MGWYADTTWDITFHSQEALEAAVAEANMLVSQDNRWFVPVEASEPEGLLELCGENSDINMEEGSLHIVGWTTGKWAGVGDDILHMLAKFADGTVEFDTQDGERYMWRMAEGKVTAFNGIVIYPADPACEWVKK